jgi:phasin family protein
MLQRNTDYRNRETPRRRASGRLGERGEKEIIMVSKSKVENGSSGFEDVVAAGTRAAETFVKATSEAFEAFKGYEGVPAFGKENVEAVVKSQAALAKGFETLSVRFAELAKASVEDSLAASKAFMGCKTVKDVIDVQGNIVRASFGKIVSEGAAITELGAKVASDAIAPIATQVSATIEKFTRVAA